MAELILNPDINNLDTDESLASRKRIYTILLDGMLTANGYDNPDYSAPPYCEQITDSDGKPVFWENPEGEMIPLTQPNQKAIQDKMAEISSIQMKNAAYLFAHAIDEGGGGGTGGSGGSFDGSAYILKSGGSMTGTLKALHGFYAGAEGNTVLSIYQNNDNINIVDISGLFNVVGDASITGKINVGNSGIWFAGNQAVYYDNGKLYINNPDIALKGCVNVDGSFKLGDLTIDNNGIALGDNIFYHSGNSNLKSVDWSMKDAHVFGTLIVEGKAEYKNRLIALCGFNLGDGGQIAVSSEYDNNNNRNTIHYLSDLNIGRDFGIMYDGMYLISARDDSGKILSFSAPGRILNLGDSSLNGDSVIATQCISLQSDVYDSSHKHKLIGHTGSGNFPDGFSAGVANAGDWAMRTFTHSASDYGVVFHHSICFDNDYGPKIKASRQAESLSINLPYSHIADDNSNIESINFEFYCDTGKSIWHYSEGNLLNDIGLHVDTDADCIVFNKPVESLSFSINSLKYKTRLKENALFLRENVFIEGTDGGLLMNGTAYFINNLQSRKFSSGYSGYGWGIIHNEFAGGYHATFDELTVRKKMRIYELEVQKTGAVNGALWVSDSCSGDLVQEII